MAAGKESVFESAADISVVLIIICSIGIIAFTVMFEWATKYAELILQHTPYHQMLGKVYKEMMIMGLIAFTLFIALQCGVYTDPTVLVAFEFSHVLIFITAIFFVLQAILTMLISVQIRREYDVSVAVHVDDLLCQYAIQKKQWKLSLSWLLHYWRLQYMMEIKMLRCYFRSLYQLPYDFDFAEYMSICLNHHILEIVEVEGTTWLVVVVIGLILLGVIKFVSVFKPGWDFSYNHITRKIHISHEGEVYAVLAFLALGWSLLLLAILLCYLSLRSERALLRKAGCQRNDLSCSLLKWAKEENDHQIALLKASRAHAAEEDIKKKELHTLAQLKEMADKLIHHAKKEKLKKAMSRQQRQNMLKSKLRVLSALPNESTRWTGRKESPVGRVPFTQNTGPTYLNPLPVLLKRADKPKHPQSAKATVPTNFTVEKPTRRLSDRSTSEPALQFNAEKLKAAAHNNGYGSKPKTKKNKAPKLKCEGHSLAYSSRDDDFDMANRAKLKPTKNFIPQTRSEGHSMYNGVDDDIDMLNSARSQHKTFLYTGTSPTIMKALGVENEYEERDALYIEDDDEESQLNYGTSLALQYGESSQATNIIPKLKDITKIDALSSPTEPKVAWFGEKMEHTSDCKRSSFVVDSVRPVSNNIEHQAYSRLPNIQEQAQSARDTWHSTDAGWQPHSYRESEERKIVAAPPFSLSCFSGLTDASEISDVTPAQDPFDNTYNSIGSASCDSNWKEDVWIGSESHKGSFADERIMAELNLFSENDGSVSTVVAAIPGQMSRSDSRNAYNPLIGRESPTRAIASALSHASEASFASVQTEEQQSFHQSHSRSSLQDLGEGNFSELRILKDLQHGIEELGEQIILTERSGSREHHRTLEHHDTSVFHNHLLTLKMDENERPHTVLSGFRPTTTAKNVRPSGRLSPAQVHPEPERIAPKTHLIRVRRQESEATERRQSRPLSRSKMTMKSVVAPQAQAQFSSDLSDAYLFGSPFLFHKMLEILLLLNCLYLSLYFTRFLMVTFESDLIEWNFIMPVIVGFPELFILPMLGFTIRKAGLLEAVAKMKPDIITKVIEHTLDVRKLSEELRQYFLIEFENRGLDKRTGMCVLFAELDGDSDGGLSYEEFKFGLHKLDLHVSSHRLMRLFRFLDVDKRQQITFNEFYRLIEPADVERQDNQALMLKRTNMLLSQQKKIKNKRPSAFR